MFRPSEKSGSGFAGLDGFVGARLFLFPDVRGLHRFFHLRMVLRNAFQPAEKDTRSGGGLLLGKFGNEEVLPCFDILFRAP
jgi:hypothetical protein